MGELAGLSVFSVRSRLRVAFGESCLGIATLVIGLTGMGCTESYFSPGAGPEIDLDGIMRDSAERTCSSVA